MKFKKVMAMALAGAMVVSTAACGKTSSDKSSGKSDTTTPSNVSLTVWGAEEDQELLTTLVNNFKEAYADTNITFDIQIGVESEATAKDTILKDIEAAADVFAFASDQITDLTNAKALAEIDALNAAFEQYANKTVDDIKSANSAGSVEAASVDGKLYGFPMAGDNGYFLIYDSSVLTEDDVKTWDSLLAAADKAGKKVGMTFNSGWYNASFFYGAGFTTGLNEDGTTAIDWDGTSKDGYKGVDVVKSMLNIASDSAFLAVADGDSANQLASGSLCAIVSGTWDVEGAEKVWGDAYAATKLPTYTLNGAQIQQGSVAGFKFVGVNNYSKNVGWAALLADYITNEESQALRFEQRQIGPTNTNVAASDAVAANKALAALSAQGAYGVVQTVGSNFWESTKTFGEMIAQGTISADDDAAIQEALDTMVAGVTQATE